MDDMTATEVRMRAQVHASNVASLWSDHMHKVLKDELVMITGVNNALFGRKSIYSYLTVRRGSVWSPPRVAHDSSVWHRFGQGYQIPRAKNSSIYVDLTLKVSPRQDVKEDRVVLPAAVKSSHILTPEAIQKAVEEAAKEPIIF